MPRIATADRVSREKLLQFVSSRHRYVLMTTRADGRPQSQLSPVTGGVDDAGRLVISTYPDRAKAVNLRRNPAASVLVVADDWDDASVQVDGTAEVLDMPSQEAEDGEYFRCIAGDHPDWAEYRAAMRKRASRSSAHHHRVGAGDDRRIPARPRAGLTAANRAERADIAARRQ